MLDKMTTPSHYPHQSNKQWEKESASLTNLETQLEVCKKSISVFNFHLEQKSSFYLRATSWKPTFNQQTIFTPTNWINWLLFLVLFLTQSEAVDSNLSERSILCHWQKKKHLIIKSVSFCLSSHVSNPHLVTFSVYAAKLSTSVLTPSVWGWRCFYMQMFSTFSKEKICLHICACTQTEMCGCLINL